MYLYNHCTSMPDSPIKANPLISSFASGVWWLRRFAFPFRLVNPIRSQDFGLWLRHGSWLRVAYFDHKPQRI